MLCQNCNKRLTCKHICKEAEKFINQDRDNWRETPVSIYQEDEQWRVYETIKKTDKPLFSRQQEKIVLLMNKGLNRNSITQLLEISGETYDKQLKRIKIKTRQITIYKRDNSFLVGIPASRLTQKEQGSSC